MYQAVWKLTALGVVVAVGVLVVVLAQRGMQDGDAAAENEVASTDSEEGADGDPKDPAELIEPPSQGEPEMAGDEEPASGRLPAAAKARKNARTSGGSAALNDGGLDEETEPSIQTTAGVGNDPFGDGESDEMPSRPKVIPRVKSVPAASPKKAAIDIVDLDDEDAGDLELETKPKSKPAARPELAGKGRGPVLMLDSAGDDDAKSESNDGESQDEKAGPRLLGASDHARTGNSPATKAKIDPFADDDELPVSLGKNSGTSPADEDEMDAADDESPPARLPRSDLDSKPKPVAGRPLADDSDADTDEMPVIKRPSPGPAIESTPAEMPSIPGTVTAEPTTRQTEIPQIEEEPAEEPPAPRKADLPQLTIEKVAPPTAVLGEPMVYHIHVRNTGALPAHQVVVEDVVPDNVKMDGSIPQAQLKQNRLIWKLGTLPAGQERKIAVRVIPQNEGTIGSVATVNFAPQPQPQTPRQAASTSANAPKIKFIVESPRKAAVGMPVDFNFKIKNVGTVPATGVTIRDVLPAALKHSEGDDLEFTIGQIPPGKTQDVKLTLTAAVAGPTVNRVVVTADGNVSEEADVQLEVVGPKLSVSRSGTRKLFPDKIGRYTNTVTNPGGHQISGATLVEAVPAGMEFVEADNGGRYDPVKRTVTWMIKQLNPGESQTVKVALRSTARGAQISVVRAYDNSGASGETVGTTHVAGVPALKIEIGELTELVEVGELVKVPIRVQNRGSDVANNVRTRVAVPAGMQFVSARGPVEHRVAAAAGAHGSAGASEVQFAPIGKIDAKADAVYELTFKARVPGATRVEVHTQCEQMGEPIRSEVATTIVTPQ